MTNKIVKVTSLTAVVMVALVLMISGCVSDQSGSTPAPRSGKLLVGKLPAQARGVELAGVGVRVRSGFQWVKQPNGTVTVARMGAAGGVAEQGTWSCECTGGKKDNCEAEITKDTLSCVSKSGPHGIILCLDCKLSVKTGRIKTGVLIY